MSKQTAWAHLPNAHHIDRILVNRKKHPQGWVDAVCGAARGAARDAAWSAAWDAAWSAAWAAARGAERDAERGAAWAAIAALIAWDDAGAILDMPTDAIRLLAASGHHPAVLLLPAAIALSTAI